MKISHVNDRDKAQFHGDISIEISGNYPYYQIDFWFKPNINDHIRYLEDFDTINFENPHKVKSFVEDYLKFIKTLGDFDVCIIFEDGGVDHPHDISFKHNVNKLLENYNAVI